MARTIVHRGRRIIVAVDTLDLADGRTVNRDVVLHPGGVVILPMVDADTVCLLRHYRFVIDDVLWELPAGGLEPGEDPAEAAIRELREETGFTATRWTRLTSFLPSPGFLDEVLHVFVAEGLTPGAASPEAGEDLEHHLVPVDRALAWIRDGTIRDGKTILSLFWWESNGRRI